VFLVDDNDEFRSSVLWWLSGAGYAVRDFSDAESALQALKDIANGRPEELRRACLLLDVRMPGLSGLDLHDRLSEVGLASLPGSAEAEPCDSAYGVDDVDCVEGAALQSGPQSVAAALPVVYMTGHGDVPLAVAAMQKGAITMLEKPFADDAMEQALERAFAAAESAWARWEMATTFPDSPLPPLGTTVPAGPAPEVELRLEFRRRYESLSPRQLQVLDGIVGGRLSKQIAFSTGLSRKTVEFHRKCLMRKMGARNALELVRMAMSRRVLSMLPIEDEVETDVEADVEAGANADLVTETVQATAVQPDEDTTALLRTTPRRRKALPSLADFQPAV
jgi:two-component system, LuxR family, response regulator FixJ